jgi:hypothetical protein
MIVSLFKSRPDPPAADGPVSAKEAQRLIQNGKAPAGLWVKGHLNLSNQSCLQTLPSGLQADSIDLSNCLALTTLPEGIKTRRLNLSGCRALRHLPAGLRCYELNLSGTVLAALPRDLQVEFRLDLSRCTELISLPDGLKVGSLILRDCTALDSLPEGLNVCFLDISGCIGLRRWPRRGSVQVGRLSARGCMQLTLLPDWMTRIAQLDLAGCDNLTELPAGLQVHSWIDIANTGIRSLPAGMESVQLRWRGVTIDQRIAFQPETITPKEIFDTQNLELRRVLLERMGYEAFLHKMQAEALDRDTDPGGERGLLRVPLPNDEPLVCLAVFCPSTQRQYVLRVPPNMRTCRQAAAWLAGFDNPNDYRPLVET